MDEALQTLVASLLKWVLKQPQFATQSHAPPHPPVIRFLPQEDIARVICGEPCGARAYHLPDAGIFLDATLDPVNDMHARSILLHELVHHVQHTRARFGALADCERNRELEREAYWIQNEFLYEHHSPVRVASVVHYNCEGEPATRSAENVPQQ
jgi:hypothetical protein